MTKHKRGNEHWTAECKSIRDDRDRLKDLLKEVYLMTGMYYCDLAQVRYKIKQSGVIDD